MIKSQNVEVLNFVFGTLTFVSNFGFRASNLFTYAR
jgi:hypothetical protein